MTTTPQQKRKARARARERRDNVRSALFLRTDAAINMAVYSGAVDDEIVKAARTAASAWNKLAQRLERQVAKRSEAA